MSIQLLLRTGSCGFLMALLGAFATLAMVLAAAGLFGLMSYAISARTREIGVRMALGADRGHVRGLFLVRGLLMVGPGVALGLLGSAAAGRLLGSALYGVEAGDPLALATALSFLIAAAAIGIALPVRRAMRVEPSIALRQE